ncbi:MAG: hypothetical protein II908_02785, partial [Bacteroidaceae bacterium]|nr:hypothetical protein [Bacteroidaceae bacterium]
PRIRFETFHILLVFKYGFQLSKITKKVVEAQPFLQESFKKSAAGPWLSAVGQSSYCGTQRCLAFRELHSYVTTY